MKIYREIEFKQNENSNLCLRLSYFMTFRSHHRRAFVGNGWICEERKREREGRGEGKKGGFFRKRGRESGGRRMRRNELIEESTMFNSTKPKTRPANYGASHGIDPEKNPDGALCARYSSFVFPQILLRGNCISPSVRVRIRALLQSGQSYGGMTGYQANG